MKAIARKEVSAGLAPNLARLWRYALVLSGARDVADDLVQATCVRALERAEQFQLGTRLDRWLRERGGEQPALPSPCRRPRLPAAGGGP